MNLKKFRIKNYKSIVDSGDCYLTDTITILAGKNESGKTSILEALEDFGTDKKIRESAKSIKSPEAVPEISITFTVGKNKLKEILEEIKSPIKATDEVELEIVKTFPDKYSFGGETLNKDILGGKENETKFLDALKQRIPNFIFFNSFEDIFPNKIPFAELEKNEWIQDLSVISDLKIDTIKGTDDRGKEKHKYDINIKLNKDYKKFWTQDVSNLSVNWDSDHLYFWIKEDGYPYEPSLRSKGRQWHLAFYIKVSARANENAPNIILIDEPGLFLHPKAQEDVLRKLEDLAKKVKIIFSTHSPYLLEADKLNRVRLIHRTNKKGTQIKSWGGKVIYLYDSDQGKKGGEKNLKDNWLASKDLILSVLGTTGRVEDIFSLSDFKKIFLNGLSRTYNGTSAEKVPPAKKFLENFGLLKKFTRIVIAVFLCN